MPRMNGFELLRRIRENGIKSKVIVLTGMPIGSRLPKEESIASAADREKLLHMADDVMGKPFDLVKLLARIKELAA